MSAWIESHQTLWHHPRKDALAEALYAGVVPDEIADCAAIGLLHKLWWWALDYAHDGDLSQFTPRQIAKACEWRGEPETLVDALVVSGFLNADLTIHDWHDYAGRLLERRERDRLRKAASRHADNPERVRGTSDGRHADSPRDGARSRAHITEPNRTVPRARALADESASAGVKSASFNGDFDEWWEAYGRIGSKAEAKDRYSWWRKSGKAKRDELLRAATAYRTHCTRTDCKMAHARTFLARQPNRWVEWAEGEEHGTMDARGEERVSDVLSAALEGFGLSGGEHERRIARPAGQPAGSLAGRPSAGRGLPAGELKSGE